MEEKENKIKKLWNYFTAYEKIWFSTLIIAGITLAIALPDEEVNSAVLVICSLLALIAGILCELLISKQNRWNFIVSVTFVEVTEIIICVILKYYASALITLLFWIPIDIISFIKWTKNKDKKEQDKTVVRKLTAKQDLLVVIAVTIFTVGVGYLLKLIGGEDTFIDACTSAVGMVNGLFILLRYREQWIAWYAYTICEAVLWIISGQWIMLVLSIGYLTNTTYGYIKWTKYIKYNINNTSIEIKNTVK